MGFLPLESRRDGPRASPEQKANNRHHHSTLMVGGALTSATLGRVQRP